MKSIQRGEIWWVSLDPAQGSEIRNTRPCLVWTNNTLNRLRKTVVVAPLSTAAAAHPPITVPLTCQGQRAVAVLDQIRAVDKQRLRSRIESVSEAELEAIEEALSLALQLN
jgi:mRNA interferase MazF